MNTVKKLSMAAAALSALGALSVLGLGALELGALGLSAPGLVRAEAGDEITDAATAEAADSSPRFTSGISASYSFAEMVNLSDAGETLRPASDGTGLVRAGTFAELSNVAESMPKRLAGANATTSLLGELSAMNGAFGDLSAIAVADELFASRSGASRSPSDARFLFASVDMPEPTVWMTLLCGVVVVAFMARRKRGSFSD